MRPLAQVAAFGAASFLSFCVDWGLFTALWRLLPEGTPGRLAASVAAARCVSLVFNYACNRSFVFAKAGGRRAPAAVSLPRYLALAACLLAGSWAALKAIDAAFPGVPLPWAKPAVDLALFAVSYAVQRKFVFT